MSLVVAHCSKRTLKIVSDTRLSDPISRLPCSHFDGALKILLLSSELGFAFAGDPAPALEVLSESQDATAHRADLQSLTALLLEKTRQSRGASDFLAFSTAPSPRLRKISAGGVSEEQADYWIGDQEAFNCYQEYFHSAMAAYPERLQHNPDYLQNQMDVAMKEVIESSRVQSVGDFLVPASSEKDGLRCVSYARIPVFPTAERNSARVVSRLAVNSCMASTEGCDTLSGLPKLPNVVSIPSTLTLTLLAPAPGVSHLAPLPACTTPGVSHLAPLPT